MGKIKSGTCVYGRVAGDGNTLEKGSLWDPPGKEKTQSRWWIGNKYCVLCKCVWGLIR